MNIRSFDSIRSVKSRSIYCVRLSLLLFISILLSADSVRSQSIISPGLTELSDTSDIKVGLVLSGGGAKGIAHIGVLRILEEAGVRIDYIAGTSIGSIVGGLYALGNTADDLEAIVRSSDWEHLFSDTPGRRRLSMFEKELDQQFVISFPLVGRDIQLPKGLIEGQNIYMWLNRHFWLALEQDDFDKLPIPFAAVATDLETGEAIIFRSGYLPDAIRASISFPTVLTPYDVGGKYAVDGGLIRNLPVQEVIEMGADYVIAVDVSSDLQRSKELTSIISILGQTVSFRVNDMINEQKELADLVIKVDEVIGHRVMDFEGSMGFIEVGERNARTHLKELIEIASRQKQVNPEPKTVELRNRIVLSDIQVEGNVYIPDHFILDELQLEPGEQVSRDEIENAVNMLYSSKLYELITYKIENGGEGNNQDSFNLRLRVKENRVDTFGLGVRFETQSQASLLLHTSFRNLAPGGTNLRVGLRLGRDIEFRSDYLLFAGIGSRLAFNVSTGYYGERIDVFSNNRRTARFTHNLIRTDLFLGNFMHDTYKIGVGLRRDFTFFTSRINPDQISFSNTDHHAIYAQLLIDSLNRRSFPSHGHQLLLQSTISDELFLSSLSFTEARFFWQGWYPLSDYLSVQNTLFLGRTTGDDLPWPYWFAPNRRNEHLGLVRFGGFNRYELVGRNFQMASTGIQYEFSRHRFLRLDAFVGNAFENWSLNLSQNKYERGYSISIGGLTILGPFEAIFSTGTINSFIYELQIGYDF